jgi:vacuolar protein sorting-associated protein 3
MRSFPRSNLLLVGSEGIQSLLPSTLISQAEALLDSHRIEEVVELADRQRRKVQANLTIDENEVILPFEAQVIYIAKMFKAEELRYVYQRIGFKCFGETRFAEAFDHFFNGELDPRLVVSYFSELRGSMFSQEDSLDVFSGVAESMPPEASVEDIGEFN